MPRAAGLRPARIRACRSAPCRRARRSGEPSRSNSTPVGYQPTGIQPCTTEAPGLRDVGDRDGVVVGVGDQQRAAVGRQRESVRRRSDRRLDAERDGDLFGRPLAGDVDDPDRVGVGARDEQPRRRRATAPSRWDARRPGSPLSTRASTRRASRPSRRPTPRRTASGRRPTARRCTARRRAPRSRRSCGLRDRWRGPSGRRSAST